jgi:hypothetical protein
MVECGYMGYSMVYTVRYGNRYKSHPYTIPVNKKALQTVKIKELQVRMMRWSAWVKDEKIPNKELDKDKWQDRFTFTLKCNKRAGELSGEELEMLNRLWKVYNNE